MQLAGLVFLLCVLCMLEVSQGDDKNNQDQEKAIIINGRLFHYEVVTFFVDHFNHMGLHSQIWLTKDVAKDPMMGQTGPAFLKNYVWDFKYFPDPHYSKDLTFNAFDDQPFKLLVYINADENTDVNWMCKLGVHDRVMAKAEHVLMVVHHAGNAVLIAPICQPPRCAIFVLGRFLEDAALKYLSLAQASARVVSAYGVFDLPARYIAEARGLKQDLMQAALQRHQRTPRHVLIQGSLRATRRRYKDLFACVENIHRAGFPLQLTLIGGSASNEEPVLIPKGIQNFTVIKADKSFDEFYPVVSSADFIVTFANEGFSYLENRSTSSVTIGMVCDVPLAVPVNLLGKYSCLRDMALHKHISRPSDCASLNAAMRLSDRDVFRMKQEVRNCKDMWRDNAREVLRHFIDSSYNASEARHVPQCEEDKDLIEDPISRKKKKKKGSHIFW